MSGDVQRVDTFFQDENYEGPERRPKGRFNYSPEHQAIINDMKEISKSMITDVKVFIEKGSGHDCTLPKSLRDHAGGIGDAINDIGDGNPGRGIAISRDTIKDMHKILNTRSRIGYEVLKWITISGVTIIGTLIATGFFERIKG